MDFVEALRASVRRVDGWANLLTGVGASNTRSTGFAHYRTGSLTPEVLESLYDEDAYAAKICDVVPEECLRTGFKVACGDARAEAATADAIKRLALVPAIKRAGSLARLYGGALVVLGVDDGQAPDLPVIPANVRRITHATPIACVELSIHSRYEDPLGPRHGLPSVYRVNRGAGAFVHASRVLRFEGASVTDRRRQQLQGWGESVLLRPYEQLKAWGATYASTSSVLSAASESVFKMRDLWQKIAQDQDDAIRRRIELLDTSRSVARSILIDSEETFERVEVGQLGGLSDLIGRYAEWLAGACQIPVTLLLGQAPAGLNATGDTDLRQFYDRSDVDRREKIEPQLDRFLRLLFSAAEGPTQGVVPSWKIEWGSFYQETEEQRQARRKTQADTDAIYLSAGVLRPDEVRASRFGKGSWSDETTITKPVSGIGTTDETGATHTLSPEAADLIMRVTESVCSRAMPRTQGVAVLSRGLGITPEEASALLADSGETYFTTPAPEHTRELDELKAAHSKLQASDRARRTFLERVLAANREGKVWTGFTPSATDLQQGAQEPEETP